MEAAEGLGLGDWLNRTPEAAVLEQKQGQLERITAHLPILITQCTRDLRYLFVNEPCARFLGKPREQIVGKAIIDVLGEPAFRTIRPYIDRVLAGERVEYETEIAYATTGVRCMHNTYVPDRDAQGTIVGWIATLVDVTERRHAEQKVREKEQEIAELRAEVLRKERVNSLGFLASALAHELKQPLAAIRTNCDAAELHLKSTRPDLAELAAILAAIQADDTRAVDTIDRMRALIKPGGLEMRALEVGEVVDNVCSLIRYEAASRRVALRCEVPRGLPCASGDRVQVSQVLLNLMLNAMDAMRSCPENARRLQIVARTVDDSVEVAVTDSGPGIAEGAVDRVFDPLFSTKPDGLGVGLAVSRTIIEAHGGRLWADSRAGANGATFRFTLPLAQQVAPSTVT